MRQYFDNLITEAKIDRPDLSELIEDIRQEMLSQCEIENTPTERDLWNAEKDLIDLIERNPEFRKEPITYETWYEENL